MCILFVQSLSALKLIVNCEKILVIVTNNFKFVFKSEVLSLTAGKKNEYCNIENRKFIIISYLVFFMLT